MDPSLKPSADQVEAARRREMNDMRDFSRMVHARLASLVQAEYDARHGTAANPITVDSDSDDDDANANDNDHRHHESDSQTDGNGANLTTRLDDLELHTLPAPALPPPFAELNYISDDASDEEDLWPPPQPSPPPHDKYQYDPDWPCQTSALRDQPLPPDIALPVPVRAPPGPTEKHFVWPDERDEYLARCPENADFSQVVFMPVPRPSSSDDGIDAAATNSQNSRNNNNVISGANSHTGTTTNTTTPTAAPPPPPPSPQQQQLLLLTRAEAAHMRDLFIAKGRALAERANGGPPPPPPPLPPTLPSPPTSSTTTATPHHHRQLLPIPHLDDDDDSERAHYELCEVCRGIRRRAVPDDHVYWTRVAKSEMMGGDGKVAVTRRSSGGGGGRVKREGSDQE